MFQIAHKFLRISTAGRQTNGYLLKVVEELNSGLPTNKSRQRQAGGLEPATSRFQIQHPKIGGHEGVRNGTK